MCSFFAILTIPRHLSLTSATLTSQAYTKRIYSGGDVFPYFCFVLFLLVNVVENLLLITARFCSAASQIKAHSAAVKFGLRLRLFSAIFHRSSRTLSTSNCPDGDFSSG